LTSKKTWGLKNGGLINVMLKGRHSRQTDGQLFSCYEISEEGTPKQGSFKWMETMDVDVQLKILQRKSWGSSSVTTVKRWVFSFQSGGT